MFILCKRASPYVAFENMCHLCRVRGLSLVESKNLLSKCQHVWVITWQIYDRCEFFSVTILSLTSLPGLTRACVWGTLVKWSGSVGRKPAQGKWWLSICGCLGSSSVLLFFNPTSYFHLQCFTEQWRFLFASPLASPSSSSRESLARSPALPDFPPKVCCLTETKINCLQNGMNHSPPRPPLPPSLFLYFSRALLPEITTLWVLFWAVSADWRDVSSWDLAGVWRHQWWRLWWRHQWWRPLSLGTVCVWPLIFVSFLCRRS